jgi:phage terminase large subunit
MDLKYGALPKQYQFITSTADEVLYSGAYGAGKTRALALWAVTRASHPYARVGLFRMKLQDLLNTTLATLLEGDGELPPILPRGSYSHNQQRRVIRIHGAGTILYDQLEDIERVASLNLSDAGIEEASETEVEHWEKVGKRCRVKVPGRENQLAGVCNPGPPSHHLAKRFGLRRGKFYPNLAFKGDEKHPLKLEAVMTTAFENPFLPQRYIARLAGMQGVMYRRYALGEWVGNEGAVYDNWDRETHAVRRDERWDRTFILVDDGTTVACAILRMRVDGDGRIHIDREVQRRGMLLAEKLAVIKSMGEHEAVIVDPAAAGLKAELRAAGYAVLDGDNDVIPGIVETRSLLGAGPDGKPGLTVDPSCETLIEQMESYEWAADGAKERPVKENDHGPDALRYGVMHLRRPPPLVFDVSGLKSVEDRTGKLQKPLVGNLTHAQTSQADMDLSIASGATRDIGFAPDKDGALKLWTPLRRGRPRIEDQFAVFAVAGDGQSSPGVVVVADVGQRTMAAQYVRNVPPERLARAVAMLALWFGPDDHPAPIGYLANTPGLVLGQHLERINSGGQAWEPTAVEFAEALGVLRAAWEGGQFVERDPSVFAVARQYVWSNSTMMHASLVGTPERRGSWADTLMARAGLWRMVLAVDQEPAELREPPVGSSEHWIWREQRQREAKEGGGIAFG